MEARAMAKREQYIAVIECKACGTRAEAEFDEVENPAHNNWN
jgi:transcription elongation factor Elf1